MSGAWTARVSRVVRPYPHNRGLFGLCISSFQIIQWVSSRRKCLTNSARRLGKLSKIIAQEFFWRGSPADHRSYVTDLVWPANRPYGGQGVNYVLRSTPSSLFPIKVEDTLRQRSKFFWFPRPYGSHRCHLHADAFTVKSLGSDCKKLHIGMRSETRAARLVHCKAAEKHILRWNAHRTTSSITPTCLSSRSSILLLLSSVSS